MSCYIKSYKYNAKPKNFKYKKKLTKLKKLETIFKITK